MKRRSGLIAGVFLLVVLFLADICCPGLDVAGAVILKYRLPKAFCAVLAGAGLSLSGLQMQSIFRNPLADPHIMGVSAGASLMAAVVTLCVPAAGTAILGTFSIAAAAFAGAVACSLLILLVSERVGNASVLLVFGVLLGFIISAVTSIMEYSASEQSLKVFFNWSAGSFNVASTPSVAVMALCILVGTVMAFCNSRGLDVIVFGDDYSESVGAHPEKVRAAALMGSCLMTGAVTAFCGPLGFVGIVGPHISRWMTGTSVHRVVIPASLLFGAAVSLLADILTSLVPLPLPAGSAMALIGIPVIFVILLCSRRTV